MDSDQAGRKQVDAPSTFLERFIAENFKRMPRVIQICVYLLFVLVLANGLTAPVWIEGRIWIKKKPASEWGDSYVLTFDGGQYVANKDGLWVVKTYQKIPGKIRLDLETNDRRPLKSVYVSSPLPIYSAFRPPFVDITYDPEAGSVLVGVP